MDEYQSRLRKSQMAPHVTFLFTANQEVDAVDDNAKSSLCGAPAENAYLHKFGK